MKKILATAFIAAALSACGGQSPDQSSESAPAAPPEPAMEPMAQPAMEEGQAAMDEGKRVAAARFDCLHSRFDQRMIRDGKRKPRDDHVAE